MSTKLFQSLPFTLPLLIVTVALVVEGTTAYSKGGGGHGGHAGGHSAHSAHHGEHHEGHMGDKHDHFQHIHAVHQGFGVSSYCLTNSFYYDTTGTRHCCDASGFYRPCFPSPTSLKAIAE